ncbi:MAG TPA: VWA domain-containing protein [Pirellulaceae bacterium]|nr:VWA domain-containing protein [Pirellulaceae bacterium]HMO91450.1 VWA domain-containing protein [Pirellulaceae bacterium]HMP69473.1 VWA domain-containing protein [Pirellulaceae bacterium]
MSDDQHASHTLNSMTAVDKTTGDLTFSDDALRLSNFGRSRTDWRSLSISLGFHCILFVLVILASMRARIGGGDAEVRRVGLVLQTVNEQQQVEYLTEQQVDRESEVSNQPADNVEALSEDVQELEPLDNTATSFDLPILDAPGMIRAPNSNPKKNSGMELTEAQKAMIAADQARFAAEANQGPEASLSIFGSGVMTGRKFVFVIDRSKSMGSQGLGVLDLASIQLSEAISQLQANHQFQIVAYHREVTTIDGHRLIPATEENKEKVKVFIDSLAAFGATHHDTALIWATSYRPDVIVFISDGGLPILNRAQLDSIRRAAGRAQIHSLEFGAGKRQGRGGFMEILAAENNGTYRYVDVNEFRKRN